MKFTRPDYVFLFLATVSGALCYVMVGPGVVLEATGDAAWLLLIILPQLAAGLLIGALLQRLVSREKITRTLGEGSGIHGLLLASLAGSLTPGGPFTSFPLVHAFWMAGADAGTLIAYVTSWSLLGLNRLIVWELPLMGWEFTWVRILVCLPLPILAGLLARWLTRISVLALAKAPAE